MVNSIGLMSIHTKVTCHTACHCTATNTEINEAIDTGVAWQVAGFVTVIMVELTLSSRFYKQKIEITENILNLSLIYYKKQQFFSF